MTYRLSWDSRCADCRTLLPKGSTGHRVEDRLLCEECSADAEWSEAEAAKPAPRTLLHGLLVDRSRS